MRMAKRRDQQGDPPIVHNSARWHGSYFLNQGTIHQRGASCQHILHKEFRQLVDALGRNVLVPPERGMNRVQVAVNNFQIRENE